MSRKMRTLMQRGSLSLFVLLFLFGFVFSSSGNLLLFDSTVAHAAVHSPGGPAAAPLRAPNDINTLTVQLRKKGTTDGTMFDSSYVTVTFYDDTGAQVGNSGYYKGPVDATGVVTLTNIGTQIGSPGLDSEEKYYVKVSGTSLNNAGYPDQFHDGAPTYHSSTLLDKADGLKDDGKITVNLAPSAGDIDLSVQDQFGFSADNISSDVYIYDAEDASTPLRTLPLPCDTDASGHCKISIDSWPAGADYRLEFTDGYAYGYTGLNNAGFNDQWYDTAPEGIKTDHASATSYIPLNTTNLLTATLGSNTIVGTLTDNQTGDPIANASFDVAVYEDDVNGQPNSYSLDSWNAQTDDTGTYTVTIGNLVTSGDHYLEFSNIDTDGDGNKDFYPDQWHSAGDAPTGYKQYDTDATSFNLDPGTNNVTSAIEPYITIVGTLTDHATGDPIANTDVTVCVDDDPTDGCTYWGRVDEESKTTDANGTYTITLDTEDPVTGDYYLYFYDIDTDGDGIDDYAAQWHTADPDGYRTQSDAVVVSLDPGTNNVTSAIEPYITIVGTLYDYTTGYTITDTTFTLDVEDGSRNRVITKNNVPVDSSGTYTVTINSTYYDSSRGAYVPWSTAYYYLYFSNIDAGYDSDGDGSKDTSLYHNQWHTADPDGYRDSNDAVAVSLTPGINPVDSHLEPRITIQGTLYDYATGDLITDTKVTVLVDDDPTDFYWYYTEEKSVYVNSSGTYSLTVDSVEPADNYYLRFNGFDADSDGNNDYPDQWHDAISGTVELKDSTTASPEWLEPGTQSVTTTLIPYSTITGQLTDLDRGTPIANATGTIAIYNEDAMGNENHVGSETVTTDANGGYTVRLAVPTDGDYFFKYEDFDVYDDGIGEYPDQWYDGAIAPRGVKDNFSDATSLPLVIGNNTVDASLEPFITINGKLTDHKTGNPIGNADVDIDVYRNPGSGYLFGDRLTTAPDGTYAITLTNAYPEADYYLYFSSVDANGDSEMDYPDQWHEASVPPAGYKEPAWAVPQQLSPGDNTVATTLDPFITIEGTLTDSVSGNNIANRCGSISIYDEDGYRIDMDHPCTTSTGAYSATFRTPLRPGDYFIQYDDFGHARQFYKYDADPAGIKRFWQEATALSLDTGMNSGVNTPLEPTANMVGTLRDADTGNPIANTSGTVEFFEKGFNGDYYGYADLPLTTDASGRYTITNNLRHSSYKVQFYGGDQSNRVPLTAPNGDTYPPQYHDNTNPGQQVRGLAEQVDLAVGDNTLASDLQRGYRIGGVLTDGSTTTPITDTMFVLYLYDPVDGTFRGGMLNMTDATGRYTMTVEPGEYLVGYEVWLGRYADTWYDNKPGMPQADTLDMTGGDNLNVDQLIWPRERGGIEGTVTDETTGGTLDNVMVDLYRNGWHYNTTWTDSSGKYEFAGLPVDHYQVEFLHGGYETEWYDDMGGMLTADLVQVTDGMTETVDAALTPGTPLPKPITLTVKLDNSSGDPAFVHADLWLDEADGGPRTPGWTPPYAPDEWDALSATFTYYNLDPGRYKLHVNPAMQYEQQWFGAASGADYYDQYAYDMATVIELDEGDSRDIVVTLQDLPEDACVGSINGTVTREDNGDPATGEVHLYDAITQNSLGTTAFIDRGEYTFKCLHEGRYQLQFDPQVSQNLIPEYWDDKSTLDTADIITVDAANSTHTADAQLASSAGNYSLVVTVETASGDPIEGIEVEVRDANAGFVWDTQMSDAQGQTLFTLIQGMEYEVSTLASGVYLATELPGTMIETSDVRREETIVPDIGGRIVGQVKDADTGDPIGFPDVRVYHSLHETSIPAANIVTDLMGNYEVTNLPAGDYKLGFMEPGYEDSYADNGEMWEDGKIITVGEGQTVKENEDLMPVTPPDPGGGTISGRVTLATTGEPLGGAYVRLYDADGNSWYWDTYTAPDGSFSFHNIPVGRYTLRYNPPYSSLMSEWWDNQPNEASATYVDLGDGEIFDASAALDPSNVVVRGRLVNMATGRPISETMGTVWFYDEMGDMVSSQEIETDEDGYYTAYVQGDRTLNNTYLMWFDLYNGEFPGQWHENGVIDVMPPPDEWEDAIPVTLPVGETSVVSHLEPYAVYHGTLVDKASGDPLEYAEGEVDFYEQDEDGDYGYVHSQLFETDADGEFIVEGRLLAGTHKVAFSALSEEGYPDQWHDNGYRTLDLADPVALLPGSPSDNNITTHLVAGAPVTGVLRDAVTNELLGNEAFEVHFVDPNTGITHVATSESGRTDYPSGAFEVSAFLGTYEVEIHLLSGDYDPTWYDNQNSQATANTLTVGAGGADLGTQDMQPRGTIWGQVTDTSGNPIEDARVYLYEIGSSSWDYFTTETGHYTFTQVSAGTYHLDFASPSGSNYLQEYYDNRDNLLQADPINLGAGDERVINVDLDGGRTLTVQMRDAATTDPIDSAADLYLYNAAQFGSPIYPSDWDTDTGIYTFTGLLADEYRLFAYAGGYKSEWYKDVEPSSRNLEGHNRATDIDLTSADATIVVDLSENVGPGTISGMVKGEASGNPIAGAMVWLLDGFTGNQVDVDYQLDQGYYEFSDVPIGLYKLQFIAPGHATEYYNDQASLDQATVVTIDQTTTDVTADAQLAAAGRLGVTVTTAGGVPLEGVGVGVYNLDLGGNWWNTTDADGKVLFDRLPAGNYRVTTSPMGEYIGYDEDNSHAVAANARTDVTIQMQQGGRIEGQVLNVLTGLPVNYIGDIQLYRSDMAEAVDGYTWAQDGRANYIIEGVPAGDYKIRYEAPGYIPSFADPPAEQWEDGAVITVGAGQTTVQDVSLWPDQEATIVGRVTLSTTGQGVGNVEVDLFDAVSGNREHSTTTASDGSYTIGGLTPDKDYVARYRPPSSTGFATEWWNDQASLIDADTVNLVENEIFTADVELSPVSGEITGRVTASDTGKALVGIDVAVYRASSGELVNWTTTQQGGTYHLKGLQPDVEYLVLAQDPRDDYSGHWYNSQMGRDTADAVQPTTASPVVAGVDFALGQAGIHGYITDSNGRGLPGVTVEIYSDNAEEFSPGTTGSSPWAYWDTFVTDGAGYFSTDSLMPGDYTVEAWADDGMLINTFYDGATDWRDADLIPVGIDGFRQADITMITGETLTGQVVEEGTTTGLANVVVNVNGQSWEQAVTDADGNFTVTGLAPDDDYTIHLDAPVTGYASRFPSQWYDRTEVGDDAVEIAIPYGDSILIEMSETPESMPLDQYDMDLYPAVASAHGVPGSSVPVSYTLYVENTGMVTDTYDVTYMNTWPAMVSPSPVIGPVAPGEVVEVTVEVAIPASAPIGSSDELWLKVASQNNPHVWWDAMVVTTAVGEASGVLVAPQAVSQRATAGETISYTLDVINTGNVSDTFDLAVAMGTGAGATWNATVSPQKVGPLAPRKQARVVVTIKVDPAAANGDTGIATLTATSQSDPTKSGNSTMTTTVSDGGVVDEYGVTVSPEAMHQMANADTTVNYVLTVINNGTMADSFSITTSSNQGWSITAPATVGPLQPGATGSLLVKVTVPAGAADGDIDETTVTATSQGDSTKSDSSVLTTEVTDETVLNYGVAVSPPSAGRDVSPGGTTSYQLEVFNTGNTTDTITVGVGTTQWTTTVSPTTVGPLAAGESENVVVRVTVPDTATDGKSDQAVVTATSQGDSTKTDSATLTTTAREGAVSTRLIVAPSEALGTGVPGMRSRYSIQVWNIGPTADTFDVTLSGNSWDTRLSKSSLSIAPGSHATIAVSVTIPLTARGGDEDNATIQVTSQTESTNAGSATIKTVVASEEAIVGPGDSFTTNDGRVKITIRATGEEVYITYTPLVGPAHPLNGSSANIAADSSPTGVAYFVLQAYDAQTHEPLDSLTQPVDLEVRYNNAELQDAGVDPSALGILSWNGNEWEEVSSQHNTTNQVLSFQMDRLGDIALAGIGDGIDRVFLPVVIR